MRSQNLTIKAKSIGRFLSIVVLLSMTLLCGCKKETPTQEEEVVITNRTSQADREYYEKKETEEVVEDTENPPSETNINAEYFERLENAMRKLKFETDK